MKKYLLGGLAAICCAVGLSSYTGQQFSGPYYFKTNTGVNKITGVAQVYSNAEVTRVALLSDVPCPIPDNIDCVVTFNTSALTQTNFSLLISPAQQRSTAAIRSAN